MYLDGHDGLRGAVTNLHEYYMQKITLILFIVVTCFFTPCAFSDEGRTGPEGALLLNKNIIIDKSTTYENKTIELHQGSFIVKNNAVLTIHHCRIKGVVSPHNLVLFNIQSGKLVLTKSQVNVVAKNIEAHPTQPSTAYVVKVDQGEVRMFNNNFSVSEDYTVGLLSTGSARTNQFEISHNIIKNFHGGIFLLNNENSKILYNTFFRVSNSNIFNFKNNHILIEGNTILFSGNNNIGDGIDVVASEEIDILKNFIASGSCYSIVVLQGNNIRLRKNSITSGITYGIYINNAFGIKDEYISAVLSNENIELTEAENKNILIAENLLDQNRFGLTAHNVKNLYIKNNIFIQRFNDNATRRTWTNNDILLSQCKDIVWEDNLYKEAYSQRNDGDNDMSLGFVPFPAHGGVVISKVVP